MPFDPELDSVAERFVQFVHREAGMPVIVCDETATIARATLRERIGNHHPGAQKIMRGEVPEFLVTAEMEAADPRAKQGCNSPIRLAERLLGTFGVAGPIAVARPIAHVAAGVLAGWIRELGQRRRLRAVAAEVVATVAALSARVEEAARDATENERQMAAASARAAERAARTDDVLRAVQGIAAQSRTLAINGGVEASRAGDMGRAFAVVAREMLSLAEDARASATRIQESLGAVRTALVRHAETLAAVTRAGGDQLDAMRALARTVGDLRQRVDGLAASFDAAGGDEAATAEELALDERFWDVSERFMRFVAAESGQPVIVCDGRGLIVRAMDRARIGTPHAGAQRILRGEADEAAITAEEAARDASVKEGCSCPIVVGGQRVGTFGVTGPLELTRPLARVAASVLATRVREHRSRAALERGTAEIFATVDGLAARTRAAAEAARGLIAGMEAASAELSERLHETGTVAAQVQQVSQQSRIIAVNGAVEAAGSAERTRVFGNVARDMVRLADDTHRAGKQIGEALGEIAGAVKALTDAGALLQRAGRVRGEAADAVLGSVGGLRGTLESLLRDFDADDAALSR